MSIKTENIGDCLPVTSKIDLNEFDITVNSLLMGIGAEKYINIFKKKNIGQTTLIELSDNDLQKLGVDDEEIRRKILDEVQNLPIFEEIKVESRYDEPEGEVIPLFSSPLISSSPGISPSPEMYVKCGDSVTSTPSTKYSIPISLHGRRSPSPSHKRVRRSLCPDQGDDTTAKGDENLGLIEIADVLEESSQHMYRIYLSMLANTLAVKKTKDIPDCLLHRDKYASDIAISTLSEINKILNSMDIALHTEMKGFVKETKKKNKKILVATIGTVVISVLAVLFARSLKQLKQ